MRKYNLTCAYCGSEFESKRSDALYCSNSCRTSNSRDNKQEKLAEQATELYTIKYAAADHQIISKKANTAGMTEEEYIKFISLNSVKDYSKYINDINELNIQNKELKAKLLFYTDNLEQGLFLDINEETLFAMYTSMVNYGMSFQKLEDYVVYASLNMDQVIQNTIKQTLKKLKKK